MPGLSSRLRRLFEVPVPRVEHGVHRARLERQEPVQELRHLGDRAHVELAVGIEHLDAHLLLHERRGHPRGDRPALAPVEVHEPVVQAGPRERGLQVELGRQEPLARRLPLALRERPELVEPPRDGGQEAALGFQVRGHEHELGRARLVGPVDPAHALYAPRAAPARLDAVEDAALLVLGREIGVVAPARSASLAEHEHPALARHELVGLRVACSPRAALFYHLFHAIDGLGDEPPTTARHLGHGLGSEVGDDLVEHSVGHAHRAHLQHQPVPSRHGFWRLHEVPRRVLDGPRADAAVVVLVLLVERGREARLDELQELVARRHVEVPQIITIRHRLGVGPLGRRLHRGHELHDAALPVFELALHVADEARSAHRDQDVEEEPLVGAPELAVRCCSGTAAFVGLRDLEGALDVAEHDLPRLGAAVVGLGLMGFEVVDERPVVHAVVGHGPGEVEPHRLEVFRHELHRRDAACGHLLDERLDGRERGTPAPEPEAGRVGEVGDLGSSRRAGVDDAGVRKPSLEFDTNERTLGCFLDSTAPLAVEGGGHVVALVEDDHALEVGLFTAPRQPGHDLLQPVDARLHPVPLSGLALERVVAREADALRLLDGSLARAEVEHEVGRAAQGGPVADGVAHEAPVLGHPECPAAALEHVVEDDRG